MELQRRPSDTRPPHINRTSHPKRSLRFGANRAVDAHFRFRRKSAPTPNEGEPPRPLGTEDSPSPSLRPPRISSGLTNPFSASTPPNIGVDTSCGKVPTIGANCSHLRPKTPLASAQPTKTNQKSCIAPPPAGLQEIARLHQTASRRLHDEPLRPQHRDLATTPLHQPGIFGPSLSWIPKTQPSPRRSASASSPTKVPECGGEFVLLPFPLDTDTTAPHSVPYSHTRRTAVKQHRSPKS